MTKNCYHTCFQSYSKIILEKQICITGCGLNENSAFEHNICYQNCSKDFSDSNYTCYKKCPFYFYFDKEGNYTCTTSAECPSNSKITQIQVETICIFNINMETYLYQFSKVI